jgi:fructokinase
VESRPVVVVGEALVDMIEVDSDRGRVFLPASGGSALNVSCGVARLGSPVEFAGSVSTDALGLRLRGFLAGEGVRLDLTADTDFDTTIAMTTFVNAEPRYQFYGEPHSYAFCPPAIALRETVSQAPVVHAGSLGVVEDMTFDAMLECFRAATGVVTFDPNIRPRMVTDWDVLRERIGALIRFATVVKYSLEDIEALYPGNPPDRIAYATLQQGPTAVIVTRAGDGADVFTASGENNVPIARGFDLVDTTGGGDAAMAAIIHQLYQRGVPSDHAGWVHVVDQAMIVSGLTCSRPGGAIAMPTAIEAKNRGFST